MLRLLLQRQNARLRFLASDLTSSHCHQFNTGLCGTPAPILLRSLGVEDKKVELDPPATVSCDLAKALSEWVDAVQREAKELLGATVVKLRASSYACRNIYNRAQPPLSQHALANALDVGGFVLSSGEHITVREDWRSRSAESQSPVRLASAAISLPNGHAGHPREIRVRGEGAREPPAASLARCWDPGPIRRTETIST